MFTGQRPDITPAQILALITWLVGMLITNGFIDNNTGKIITGAAVSVVPAAIAFADAHIRNGRNIAKAAEVAAATKNTTPIRG